MAKVIIRKRNGKYRTVDRKTGRIARNQYAAPVDGGGFSDRDDALRQRDRINESIEGRKSDQSST